jgi:hypothetical protein
VTCPTSEYLDDIGGFKVCPICVENKINYKQSKTSPSCKEMYDRMKRQFHGFALAYIVSDPVNPANNNTVKVIKYGIGVKTFLRKEIFDIDDDAWRKKDEPEVVEEADKEEIVGFGAFDLNNGYDFIVSVTAKSEEYKQYGCKFSRTATAVAITEEEIQKQVAELKFDEDFYTVSSKTDILKLYNRFMSESPIETETETNGIDQFDMPPAIVAEKKVEQPVKAVSKPTPVLVPVSTPSKGEMTINLDDIDAIIEEVTKK